MLMYEYWLIQHVLRDTKNELRDCIHANMQLISAGGLYNPWICLSSMDNGIFIRVYAQAYF